MVYLITYSALGNYNSNYMSSEQSIDCLLKIIIILHIFNYLIKRFNGYVNLIETIDCIQNCIRISMKGFLEIKKWKHVLIFGFEYIIMIPFLRCFYYS